MTVKIIDIHAVAQLLRRDGVPATLQGLGGYLQADFARWEDFDKQARLATHYPWGVIELMPVADGSLYGFKYVNGHPGNPRRGLQTVTAVGMLADVATGYPQLISEMTVLTALRTAATSALAARYCARPDAGCMAMIGTGSQAEFQALAIAGVLPVDRLRCFDLRAEAVAKLRRNLRGYGLEVQACSSIDEALDGADLVTTATAAKRHQRVLTPAQVRPGMHINAIGGDCPGKTELDPAILDGARIVVEYAPQTRVEGEIQQAPADLPVIELWELVSGHACGRRDDDEVTLFDSVGFALEDFSALRYVRDRAEALGLGYASALVPELVQADDLFGAMMALASDEAGRVREG